MYVYFQEVEMSANASDMTFWTQESQILRGSRGLTRTWYDASLLELPYRLNLTGLLAYPS